MARINRAIELLEQGQPIYYAGHHGGGYEAGREWAHTWADYITYEMEHAPLDVVGLREFMRGLADGGPTRSGHRTPAVIVTLPFDGIDEAAVRANAWIIKQILACGVHGLLMCHAEEAGAVRAFVESARFPFNTAGVGQGLDDGRRGNGGQSFAAEVWGLDGNAYTHAADPWPLNPKGELFLGLKIENKRALANCEATAAVPGIGFAEWGPGDMGMSLGYADNHDAPYPPLMSDARARIFAACKANGVAFLNSASPDTVAGMIDEGVRIISPHGEPTAIAGRRHSKRTMPV